MSRPAFVKLGGSVLTDKARECKLRKAQARRLIVEVARSEVPTVLFHGAGSFGHPAARRAGLTEARNRTAAAVAETLSHVGSLHAQVVAMAEAAGLQPVSVPLHLAARCEAGAIVGAPTAAMKQLLADGCTPVVTGTVVRDDAHGWRIVSADWWMEHMAADIPPRLGLFVTDVPGVMDRDPREPGATLLARISPQDAQVDQGLSGPGDDVTGRMAGKLAHAFALAGTCPVLVVDGTVRGRVLDVLRGKSVPGTRIETS